MCRGEQLWVLSTQVSIVRAVKDRVGCVLDMFLARRCTVRAHPLRPLLLLPSPRLLRQPVGARS
jgi:hypothetical protein